MGSRRQAAGSRWEYGVLSLHPRTLSWARNHPVQRALLIGAVLGVLLGLTGLGLVRAVLISLTVSLVMYLFRPGPGSSGDE